MHMLTKQFEGKYEENSKQTTWNQKIIMRNELKILSLKAEQSIYQLHNFCSYKT